MGWCCVEPTNQARMPNETRKTTSAASRFRLTGRLWTDLKIEPQVKMPHSRSNARAEPQRIAARRPRTGPALQLALGPDPERYRGGLLGGCRRHRFVEGVFTAAQQCLEFLLSAVDVFTPAAAREPITHVVDQAVDHRHREQGQEQR